MSSVHTTAYQRLVAAAAGLKVPTPSTGWPPHHLRTTSGPDLARGMGGHHPNAADRNDR